LDLILYKAIKSFKVFVFEVDKNNEMGLIP